MANKLNKINKNMIDPTLLDDVKTQLADKSTKAELFEKTKFESNANYSLAIPTYEGSGQTTHPSVVYLNSNLNGYRYYMAHTPYPFSDAKIENPSIAASKDGVEWETPLGLTNPIDIPTTAELASGFHMSDTHIMFLNGKLECWYRLTDKVGAHDYILRKTSIDGVAWSEREIMYDTLSDGGYFISPSVLYEDGKYKMWGVGKADKILYLEGVTGKNDWSEPVEVPVTYRGVEGLPWHLEVMKDLGKYVLILNAFRRATVTEKRVIMIAESVDGLSFNDLRTIIDAPTMYANKWDNDIIYRATLINTGGHYKLYYGGMNVNKIWGIGMVEGESLDSLKSSTQISFNGDEIKNKTSLNKLTVKDDIYLRDSALNSSRIKVGNIDGVISTQFLTGSSAPGAIYTGSANILYDVVTNNLRAGKILTKVGQPYLQLPSDVWMQNSGKSPFFKILNTGVAGAGFKVESPHTVKIVNDGGTSNGSIEANGIVLKADGASVANIEGAIRYDATAKKHQGYNGTSWNDLY